MITPKKNHKSHDFLTVNKGKEAPNSSGNRTIQGTQGTQKAGWHFEKKGGDYGWKSPEGKFYPDRINPTTRVRDRFDPDQMRYEHLNFADEDPSTVNPNDDYQKPQSLQILSDVLDTYARLHNLLINGGDLGTYTTDNLRTIWNIVQSYLSAVGEAYSDDTTFRRGTNFLEQLGDVIHPPGPPGPGPRPHPPSPPPKPRPITPPPKPQPHPQPPEPPKIVNTGPVDAPVMTGLPFGIDKNDAFFRDPGNPRSGKGGRQPMSKTPKQSKLLPGKIVRTSNSSLQVRPMGENLIISRREIYVKVPASASDAILNFNAAHSMPGEGAINPGYTFRWAAQFAHLYEKYRIKRLKFEYVPSVGTQAYGKICCGFDIDPEDDNTLDGTLTGIQGLPVQISGPVNKGWEMEIPQSMITEFFGLNKSTGADKWVRPYYSDSEAHLNEFGRIWVGVTACDSTTVTAAFIGDLWASYEIEFVQPHVLLEPSIITSDKFIGIPTDRTHFIGDVSNARWLSKNPYTCEEFNESPTGLYVISTNTATLLSYVATEFLMVGEFTGTVFTATAPTISTSGCTVSNLFWITDAAATTAIGAWTLRYTVSRGYIQPNFTASCTTLTGVTLRFANYRTTYASAMHRTRTQIEGDPVETIMSRCKLNGLPIDNDEPEEVKRVITDPLVKKENGSSLKRRL